MKSELYFRHDVYTLDDPSIMKLIFKYHEAGYGVFWAVIERLTAESTHIIPRSDLSIQVAMKMFNPNAQMVDEIIAYCVETGLLCEKDKGIYNERVIRQCKLVAEHSKKQAENVKKRWDKYKANTTVLPSYNESNSNNNDNENKNNNEKKESKKEKAQNIVNLYHSYCSNFPSVSKLTDIRIGHCNSLLQNYSVDQIKTCFEKAGKSSFLAGSDRWAGATFDWLLNPSNFIKVLEGNYDNQRNLPNSSICNDSERYESQADMNGSFTL